MRTKNLLLVLILFFGTSAHAAGWRDWIPGLLQSSSNPNTSNQVTPPLSNATSGSQASSLSQRAIPNSIYDLADRDSLFIAKQNIINAVTEGMLKPIEVQPQYNAIIVRSMNDAFFLLYDNLYDRPQLPTEQDKTTMSDQNEKYRQLEHVYSAYNRMPPAIAGSWTMAKTTLDAWYRSGIKQPKVAKLNPNPMSFLNYSNSGLRGQAIDAFTMALDAELIKSNDINFSIALLAMLSNSSEYFSDGGSYPKELVSDRLMYDNEWSNFVSTSASVALTRLAQINTIEAWNQFFLAFTGGNIVMPAPHHGLHFFMTELFLKSVTPEKTQALATAVELIQNARIKARDFDRRSAIDQVIQLKEAYSKLSAQEANSACAITLGAQIDSAQKPVRK